MSDFESKRPSGETIENYAALGRYVESYERLVEAIRSGCEMLLTESRFSKIIFHHHVLTAMPLFEMWRAMSWTELTQHADFHGSQMYRYSESDRDLAKGLLKYLADRIGKAAQNRNEILHGTWYFSDPSQDGDSIGMRKFKVTKEGIRVDQLIRSAKDLRMLQEECEHLEELVTKLKNCLQSGYHENTPKGFIAFNIVCADENWKVKTPYGCVSYVEPSSK